MEFKWANQVVSQPDKSLFFLVQIKIMQGTSLYLNHIWRACTPWHNHARNHQKLRVSTQISLSSFDYYLDWI